MDKTIRYKIIGYDFGTPPRGSIMVWDEPYDTWTVTDAYNTGSSCKSIWSGNPEDFPNIYEPIIDFLPTKKMKTLDDIQGNDPLSNEELLPF